MTDAVTRATTPDGQVSLSARGCTFAYRRPRPGALLVTIAGHDAGQFGTSTLDEIRMELLRHRPLELFVDAREALGPAVSVSDEWTRFFTLNRDQLRRVNVLVGSKVVHLTVAIAQHLSRTGDLIEITSDAERFTARVASL
ncbi:MAG TPA: hypothetical protein VHJ20_01730 [Polyangia bacterium]|nr:hypothetical protein [Polyangia bacterium]